MAWIKRSSAACSDDPQTIHTSSTGCTGSKPADVRSMLRVARSDLMKSVDFCPA